MTLSQYSSELMTNAAKLARPGKELPFLQACQNIADFSFVNVGKGILAVDESTKTIGKRLESIGVVNTETNRQAYRGLLFTAPGLGKYISGAILYEETLFQCDSAGKSFVETLTQNDILPGIKVDTGLQPLAGADPIETW
jgi:fructose-bisphosphate aldolase class I